MPETVFDVASLTKVLCTTTLLLERNVPLDAKLGDLIPECRIDATVADALFHRTGLAAFRPFFAEALTEFPSLVDPRCPASIRAEARSFTIHRVAESEPEIPPRTQVVYSDLGFILLGEFLERESKLPIDRLFQTVIAVPKKIDAGFRRMSQQLAPSKAIAETGTSRPRPPAPGQEGLWTLESHASHLGGVDDDNAWVMDGVAGHAGLFATAPAVAHLSVDVIDRTLGGSMTWPRDSLVANSTRTLGFDTPSADAPSCGSRFGRAGPLGAIGHLGFTGTSLWIDFDLELVVVLLSNRVALGRHNVKIRSFRPAFHDAVLDELKL